MSNNINIINKTKPATMPSAGTHRALAPILALVLSLALALPTTATAALIKPNPTYNEVTQIITASLAKFHIRNHALNDELSETIHQRFLDLLDADRLYLLEQDVVEFSLHRKLIDDYLQQVNLEPIYEFFSIYRERFGERMRYAITLAEAGFDFDIDEYYEFDREDAPWSIVSAELDEIWRKVVKNDFLSAKLNGSDDEQARSTLISRYQSRLRSYDRLDSDDVYQWFINSYVGIFDPHSNYLSPRRSEDFQIEMSLSLQGIGATLEYENEYTRIRQLVPGGPASMSGELQPGDRITGVAQGDQEIVDIIGWRLDEVVRLIRGEKGSLVRLQILPESAPPGGGTKIVSIIRDRIKLENQAASKKILKVRGPQQQSDYKIGVIALPGFYSEPGAQREGGENYNSSSRDVERLLNEMKRDSVHGVIIDLRGNSGGHLTEAVLLAGLFLDGDPVVQVRYPGNYIQVEYDKDPQVVWGGPMAVLVDRYSASASEIFASAIQDHQRGPIIGEPTFGKGTVQNLYDIDGLYRKNGSNLGHIKITSAQFYRVNGLSTQYQGVVPDIIWPTVDADDEYGERTLAYALPQDRIDSLLDQFDLDFAYEDSIHHTSLLHRQRTDNAPGLLYLQTLSQERRYNRERTRISLHEATRRHDLELAKQRREQALEQYKQTLSENEDAQEMEVTVVPDDPIDPIDPIDPDPIAAATTSTVAEEGSAEAGDVDSILLSEAALTLVHFIGVHPNEGVLGLSDTP